MPASQDRLHHHGIPVAFFGSTIYATSMRPGLLLLVSLVAGCTRLNAGYEGDGAPQETSTSGPGSASLTSGPDDGPSSSTGGPSTGGPSTGGSSMGDGADSTSMGSTSVGSITVGSEGTTVVDSTGECVQVMVMLEPVADVFIQSGTEACEGVDCQAVDFGASPQELIQAEGEFRSYLLVSFDLVELNRLQAPLGATLTLTVGHDAGMELGVAQVFPATWSEGDGLPGQLAEPGEAAWNWSANPNEWMTPMGSGTFDAVLDGALPLGGANVPFVVGSHPVDIVLDPTAIDEWPGGPSIVHLVVTKVEGEGPVIAFSRESMASPRLMITGC
jgi:hypothetical protein